MRRPTTAKAARFHGTTLLELLVAIAVVATLATLLFHVGGYTREKSRSVKCVSNLRAVAQSMNLLIADTPQLQILTFLGGPGSDKELWARRLHEGGYLPNPDVLRCPAGKVTPGRERFSGPSSAAYWETYGLNVFDLNTRYYYKPGAPGSPSQLMYKIPLSAIPQPSRRIFFADSVQSATHPQQYFILGSGGSPVSGISLRHDDKANIVFLDGHVEAMTRQQLQATDLQVPTGRIYDLP